MIQNICCSLPIHICIYILTAELDQPNVSIATSIVNGTRKVTLTWKVSHMHACGHRVGKLVTFTPMHIELVS